MAEPSRWISDDFADDQAVSFRRAGERSIAADQAGADVRRCLRQQFGRGVAEAALIEEEEVEAGEVWCDQGELLAQRRLRQAQCSRDGKPAGLDVEQHERAVVGATGEIKAGYELQRRQAHKISAAASSLARYATCGSCCGDRSRACEEQEDET
jgi:hypothetical protein